MFELLTKHILIFENKDFDNWIFDTKNSGTMEHPIHFPFVNYSEKVDRFVEDVYEFSDMHPEYALNRYGEILEKNGLKWESTSMSDADVSEQNAECILALILGAIRAERFCDGALLSFFKNGSIEKWLKRLLEIDKSSYL